jgi:hypothetical protein
MIALFHFIATRIYNHTGKFYYFIDIHLQDIETSIIIVKRRDSIEIFIQFGIFNG